MKYVYNVAGIRVVCDTPYPLTIQDDSKEFMYPLQKNEEDIDYDFKMCFKPVDRLPEMNGEIHQISCRFYQEDEKEWRVYHIAAPKYPPYACVVWKKENPREIVCYYLNGKEDNLNYSKNITNHIGLETLLRVQKGVLFHASFIRYQGKGIIFSAPSGTGKSTQAELWKQYEGAEILNGDRAALRKVEEHWTVYGLPYAGSSGIYRNEKATLSAIVVLRQSRENNVRRLGVMEAIQYLYPEVTIHRWDREFVEEVLSILSELFIDVPVYLLECRPDKEAVEILKAYIEENEEKPRRLM